MYSSGLTQGKDFVGTESGGSVFPKELEGHACDTFFPGSRAVFFLRRRHAICRRCPGWRCKCRDDRPSGRPPDLLWITRSRHRANGLLLSLLASPLSTLHLSLLPCLEGVALVSLLYFLLPPPPSIPPFFLLSRRPRLIRATLPISAFLIQLY